MFTNRTDSITATDVQEIYDKIRYTVSGDYIGSIDIVCDKVQPICKSRKLLHYAKRRNFRQNNKWHRIRSRC